VVTTDEARTLEDISWDVRGVFDSEGDEIMWETSPILPHGTRFTWGG
jgi:hypothetical protein